MSEQTCRLRPFADMDAAWDRGEVTLTVCECSQCGGYVICPPEWTWADRDYAWEPIEVCPYCESTVVSE